MITEETYFSEENQLKYTGSSQIKDFMKCEACALAKLNGEWIEPKSKAMLVSSYIDEAISGTLDIFKAKNPEIFKRDGSLKAEYEVANIVLNYIENDEMFKKYLSGEHQVIMTGEIAEVPVKIKIDSYFPDKLIVDLKAMKDFELIWNNELKIKQNFIQAYDYILQGALYQEIVRQNTGKQLPFIIAATTKQEYPERALLNIPQEEMDIKLKILIDYTLPRIKELKEGKIKPNYCGKCDYCKSLKKVQKIYNYQDFFEEREY